MPQGTNIVVKKNDGTTDITYTFKQPAGSDRTPAIFRCDAIGAAIAHRPELKVSSRSNGSGTGRRVDGAFVYPSVVTDTNGKISVAHRLPISFSALIPSGMPDTDVNEAVSQGLNLFAAALIKSSLKEGYAPV